MGQRDAGGDGTWKEGRKEEVMRWMRASEERTSNIIVCDGMPDREREGGHAHTMSASGGGMNGSLFVM